MRIDITALRNKLKSDKQWAKYDLQLLYESFSFEYGDLASHEAFLMYIPHVEAPNVAIRISRTFL